jgi:hypothetical protein
MVQIGRVLGKAIYDGILVDVSFAGFFREYMSYAAMIPLMVYTPMRSLEMAWKGIIPG